jgi:hypothetical protein
VEGAVVAFFEKTWFFWWMLANVIILRWFQVFSSVPGNENVSGSDDQQATKASRHVPSAV